MANLQAMLSIRAAVRVMLILAIGLTGAAEEAFASRQQPSSWAEEAVLEGRQSGILPAWIEGQYAAPITRVQFAEMLLLLYEGVTGQHLNGPIANPFRDTRSFYAAQSYNLGLVNGTGTRSFSPDKPVTREQLAVMFYNLLDLTGHAERLLPSVKPVFADKAQFAGWASDEIAVMTSAGLLEGSVYRDRVYFEPKRTTTVEEAAVLANRIYKQFGTIRVTTEQQLLRSAKLGIQPVVADKRLKAVYTKAQSVLAQIIRPGMDDYEKELAIHDYLVLHTAYDQVNYERDTVPDDSYSAYGALVKGVAVCQGYANAANLLLNMAGVEAHIITGTVNGEAHAWNKVKIGGDYYNLDVTWDDPVPDVPGRVQYGYFNVTDEELRQDHSWQVGGPAADGTAYNYHVRSGLLAINEADFAARIWHAVESRSETLTVKRIYTNEKDLSQLTETIFAYEAVQSFDCAFGSGGVITLTFQYR